MPVIPSWMWYSAAPWPGFSTTNQDVLGSSGNGLSIDPAGYTTMTWNDNDGDGTIFDADTDDGFGSLGDTVTIGGATRTVKEIAAYGGSTFVHKGVTYTTTMGVWLFSDGTYAVRINDAAIPDGHYKKVTAITLGSFNGVDYSNSFTATRDDPFVCFAAGTMIQTDRGERPVEHLRPGDRVLTADRGYQPIRWTGRRRLAGTGSAAPVRIAPGALGNARALRVSQQHRMLLRGWRAELISGRAEVLAPALSLVDGAQITLAPCDRVTYVHLLFDRHEVIYAEGIASESFHPGAWGLSVLDAPARAELLRLFPELAETPALYGPTARPALTPAEARTLRLAA